MIKEIDHEKNRYFRSNVQICNAESIVRLQNLRTPRDKTRWEGYGNPGGGRKQKWNRRRLNRSREGDNGDGGGGSSQVEQKKGEAGRVQWSWAELELGVSSVVFLSAVSLLPRSLCRRRRANRISPTAFRLLRLFSYVYLNANSFLSLDSSSLPPSLSLYCSVLLWTITAPVAPPLPLGCGRRSLC